MKKPALIVFVILIFALMIPSKALAKGLYDDKLVFGGTYVLSEGERLDGDLVVFGGVVTLEPGSVVNGDIVLIGGTLDADGQINGDLVGLGGVVRLGEHTEVNGDLATLGVALLRANGAQIRGQVVTGLGIPLKSNIRSTNLPGISFPKINFSPVVNLVWFVFRVLMWGFIATIVVMILEKHSSRVAQAAISTPVITLGLGLLLSIISPIAVILLAVTIIFIPISIAILMVLLIVWAFGLISLGYELGNRIVKMINQDWAPAINAGLGTIILMFVVLGFDEVVPCIGVMPKFIVGIWGLGAVLITRFGTQEYPENPVIDHQNEIQGNSRDVESIDHLSENQGKS
ncbi:MAG: hypothetical protein J7L73_02205 [Anaerolineales bacterium]|nr:hypothetical protein [Anaerolineales bacterium]